MVLEGTSFTLNKVRTLPTADLGLTVRLGLVHASAGGLSARAQSMLSERFTPAIVSLTRKGGGRKLPTVIQYFEMKRD